ncbi:N-acetylmuramoyl-L-alanine amidase [Portibacter lacus]|uniref:N-acetylmuramoyl-L-alanine amidase n=1 Tax=Portibacter lacus TaxID=1099794 RepID=A0AA37WDS3_9BACT|nr:N-acetylmuramoyl-L-alanine amidase [Portibacter lacus]GLR16287.1 hypothetical protein GCM10007940_09020 [Portibacter lacus]
MTRLAYIFLFSFFSTIGIIASDATYYKVAAENGDGVYSILRKYNLVDEYCNIKQFYKLNNLGKDAKLQVGRKYFIPILVYSYNAVNIRTSIGKDDWDLAVGIQKYNEMMHANGLRKSSYKEDKQLWVPFSSLYCGGSTKQNNEHQTLVGVPVANNNINKVTPAKVEAPSSNNSSTKRNFKVEQLFGKAYEQYEEVDQSLKDKVFYIVSGHGGPDPGTMCTTCPQDLCEDEYAYDVALRLARNLKQHGAVVEIIIQDENDGIRDAQYLKCDKDERCNGRKLPLNQRARLEQRVSHINTLYLKYKKKGYKDHTVIALHVDSAGKSARKDVFFYHHKNSPRGKELAHNIHKTFQSKYDKFQKGRGYKGTIRHRGLYMVNNTNPPIVYIELANIQNPLDQKRILLNSNRQALANWIFQGLIK